MSIDDGRSPDVRRRPAESSSAAVLGLVVGCGGYAGADLPQLPDLRLAQWVDDDAAYGLDVPGCR
jgi:hypothetical protein